MDTLDSKTIGIDLRIEKRISGKEEPYYSVVATYLGDFPYSAEFDTEEEAREYMASLANWLRRAMRSLCDNHLDFYKLCNQAGKTHLILVN